MTLNDGLPGSQGGTATGCCSGHFGDEATFIESEWSLHCLSAVKQLSISLTLY